MEVNNLPDDVLVEIFSYVPVRELVLSVQNVCHRWREVANYNALWASKIYHTVFKETNSEIVNFLQHARKLQVLDLVEKPVSYKVLRTFVNYCPHLKHVEFHDYQVLRPRFLEEFVVRYPNLEHLRIPSETVRYITSMKIIGRLSKLKYLHVAVYDHCKEAAQLKPIAVGCPALQHLDLNDYLHAHNDLAYFLRKKKDQLLSLCLSVSGIDDKCSVPLLLICNVLRTVLLKSSRHGGIEDPCMMLEFQALRKLRTITSLTISDFGPVPIDNLVEVFDKNGMSQLLELSFVKYFAFDDRLLKAIGENCPRLKSLRLENTSFSDMGVEYICALHELENLTLAICDITEESLKHIAKFEKLKFLNLSISKKITCWSKLEALTCSDLRVLILQLCNLKGFCFQLIPIYLRHLYVLKIQDSNNVDIAGLMKLKNNMPHLLVYDDNIFEGTKYPVV